MDDHLLEPPGDSQSSGSEEPVALPAGADEHTADGDKNARTGEAAESDVLRDMEASSLAQKDRRPCARNSSERDRSTDRRSRGRGQSARESEVAREDARSNAPGDIRGHQG